MGFMQSSKSTVTKSGNDSINTLGEGTELSGDFNFAGTGVRINSVLKGKIQSEGILEIGIPGKIDAEAIVRKISIQGEFRGTIRASERIEIHKEGKVYGDIFTPCLIIEAGAFFEGQCTMGGNLTASGKQGKNKPAD